MINLKRAYEPPAETDGERILVERLWPRGISKDRAKIDLWLKDVAPSTALRKWFGHDPEKWREFRRRYAAELKDKVDLIETLRQKARKGPGSPSTRRVTRSISSSAAAGGRSPRASRLLRYSRTACSRSSSVSALPRASDQGSL